MIRAIRKSDGETVEAWSQKESSGPFACPSCGGEVVLRGEGGFRRARPPRPRAAEARVSGRKPTEVGRVTRRPNTDKTLVHQGVCGGRGYPRSGDRCGDTLKGFNSHDLQPRNDGLSLKEDQGKRIMPTLDDRILIKKLSNFD